MERVSHSHAHTTRGSMNIRNLEKVWNRNRDEENKLELSAEQRKFIKKVRTRKRRHFDRTEIPAI